MGLFEILTTIFIVLKLVGTITWSWWWVFSPMWIGYGTVVLIGFIVTFVKVALRRRKT